jgi:hypothetical protein
MNVTVPRIGSTIRVQTKFGLREGTVVPNQKWDKADTFCMTGDQYIAIRNIALANVVTIEYINGSPVKESVRAFSVKSTDGKRTYTVIMQGDKFSCECVGFTYHHKCKHVDGVKRKLK